MTRNTLALLGLTTLASFAACTVTSGDGDDDGITGIATSSGVGAGGNTTTSAQGGSTTTGDGGSTASSGGAAGCETCDEFIDSASGLEALCGYNMADDTCEPNSSCAFFSEAVDGTCGEDLVSGPCAAECCPNGGLEFSVACGECIDNSADATAAFTNCLNDTP